MNPLMLLAIVNSRDSSTAEFPPKIWWIDPIAVGG
jgi:hypothetical protein